MRQAHWFDNQEDINNLIQEKPNLMLNEMQQRLSTSLSL